MTSSNVDQLGPNEVDLVVDGFSGHGPDAQLRAHLYIDDRAAQTVTFMLSDIDRTTVKVLDQDQLRSVWRTALGEMAQRLGQELTFTGRRGLAHPILVQSRLARSEGRHVDSPQLTFADKGTHLAHFAI